MECFADWMEEGPQSLHSGCLESRGGIEVEYDPDRREAARHLLALPPLRKRRGRQQVRLERNRHLVLQPLTPCDQAKCAKDCKWVSSERRMEHREFYRNVLLHLKPKAKPRGTQYLFSLIKTEQIGEVYKTCYYLHGGKCMVRVCQHFWRKTFGLGRQHTLYKLAKLSKTHFYVSLTLNCHVILCIALWMILPNAGSR